VSALLAHGEEIREKCARLVRHFMKVEELNGSIADFLAEIERAIRKIEVR
jgi:hypothetical protein